MSTAQPKARRRFPGLDPASAILDMREPELYVAQYPIPNALNLCGGML